MLKGKYEKWKNKYCKCDISHFKIDLVGCIMHKKVHFANLEQDEIDEFNAMTEAEKVEFLNGYWNYYMVMMD